MEMLVPSHVTVVIHFMAVLVEYACLKGEEVGQEVMFFAMKVCTELLYTVMFYMLHAS